MYTAMCIIDMVLTNKAELNTSNGIYFWHIPVETIAMQTAKLFQNGRSQAVRLPKAFRLPGKEVKITRQGNQVILEPLETNWDAWFDGLDKFTEDFMEQGREQPQMQERDW